MDKNILKSKARYLFASDDSMTPQPLDVGSSLTIPSEGVEALLALVTKEEALYALQSMKSCKALGPDGFQPFFSRSIGMLLVTMFGT